jgi:hypothetical protein
MNGSDAIARRKPQEGDLSADEARTPKGFGTHVE